MQRRHFLIGSTAGLIAAQAGGGSPPQAADVAKRARLAMSSYSFHTLFPATADKKSPPPPGKELRLLDFPEMVADRYHLHHLEIVTPHFESRSPAYLREVIAKLKQTHSRIVNIPIDIGELWGQPGLSSPDAKVRERALSLYTPWMDAAQVVGARSVRCDPGKINSADLSPTIASYRTLAGYAKAKNLFVIVENHFGVGSEHPEELVRILQAVGDRAGTLPDFGNFPDQATRERGLKLLFPLARTVCHARDTETDASGKLVRFDMGECVRIARASGFAGLYSVEGESGGDTYANIQHVVDELMKHI